jgi:mannitol-1-phosphate 5-dehydrogenase
MPEILIHGAGKIGRGFIAHLAHRSGWQVSFTDASVPLISALTAAGRYRIDIAGRPALTEYIPVRSACALSQQRELESLVARCDLMACAVGAGNLSALAKALAPALRSRARGGALDWLILENADKPAETIRRTLLENAPEISAWLTTSLGLVETQVLRSGMPAEASVAATEPLAVRMHDWWTLPADRDAFRQAIPAITGLEPRSHFEHELTRKIYTFNGLNGPISFLGWINGYRLMHEAACASELQETLTTIHQESAHGLLGEFGFEAKEHAAFQAIAWNKYRDPALNDGIERNARDSARKLSSRERLLGPAALCLKHGREPVAYASAIAAAIRYEGSDDAGTMAVKACLAEGGVVAVLERFCSLTPEHPLSRLIIAADSRRAYLHARSAGGTAP